MREILTVLAVLAYSTYFRVPNNDRKNEWITAFREYSAPPYTGFICINHFDDKDLVFNKQQINLRKNAIPKVFENIENRLDQPMESDQFDESNESNQSMSAQYDRNDILDTLQVEYNKLSQQYIELKAIESERCNELKELREEIKNLNQANQRTSELCGIIDSLKAENATLRQEYNERESQICVETEKLKNEIRKMRANSEIQKDHMKYLSKKVYMKEKSVQSLRVLLDDLRTENILSAEAHEILKVSIFHMGFPFHRIYWLAAIYHLKIYCFNRFNYSVLENRPKRGSQMYIVRPGSNDKISS